MKFAKRLLLPALLSLSIGQAQSLFVDNFHYNTGNLETVSSSTWILAQGSDDLVVNSTNLTKPLYASDNTQARSLTISSSLDGITVTDLSSPVTNAGGNTVYYSFLLNVSNASSGPDGFNWVTGMIEDAFGTNAFATVYAFDSSGHLKLSISRADLAVNTKAPEILSYNTTYLIAVKYLFRSGAQDDSVFLFINPDLSGPEPQPSVGTWDNGFSRPTDIGKILISQTSNDGVDAMIDAVRVSSAWSEAPLPVQMLAFTATSARFGVDLQWSTASEINNYGFEIERREISQMTADTRGLGSQNEWKNVGFVQGAGTSNETRVYSYTDTDVNPGRYAYRIKQIDMSGAFTYYSAAEVEVGLGPQELALDQNYPNPFNPSTNITFTVPVDGHAMLKIYNMLGQEVATLFNEEAVAGRVYQKTFDASSLPTGVYVSRLEFAGQSVMRKMLFVK